MAESSGKEPAVVFLMVIALMVVASIVVWYTLRVQLLEVLRWVRYSELWVIHLFTSRYDSCLYWLRYARVNDPSPPAQLVAWANACFSTAVIAAQPANHVMDYYNLSGPSVTAIEAIVAHYARWPAAAALLGCGIYLIFFAPFTKFQTRHTLESFIHVQAKMWPVIAPIVKFNPAKATARMFGDMVPDKLPLFAEPLSPEEWVAWHRISVTNGIPDREATRRAFVQQLGPRWNGIEGLPDYMLALFVAFALRGAQKREESDDLLNRLALCWTPEKGFQAEPKLMTEIRELAHSADVGGKALTIANQHAYRASALLGILRWARITGGVLAPAQFLWLRASDRNLWYPLNNLGRRAFHTEGAGAIAHFMAEQLAKKPLPIPRVETAIVTLNQYLARPDAMPIPTREGDARA
jgi:hypothetical protein